MGLFDRFLSELHTEAREADGLEAGWLGKGPGTVARLAGALALLAWSDGDDPTPPGDIDKRAVVIASTLWSDYFRAHARSVFNQAGRSDRDRHARRAIRWLRLTKTEEVSRNNLRRDALAHAVDAEGADRVIARLEAGGILRAVPIDPTKNGRPTRRWAVNPAVR